MRAGLSYAAALLAFCAIDAVWLTIAGPKLYQPTLRDILLPKPKWPPAIVFYLLYPAGMAVFATIPALDAGSVLPALQYGAFLGAIAFATYDLTNHATLRNWTVKLTVLDIIWGMCVTAASSSAAYYVVRFIG